MALTTSQLTFYDMIDGEISFSIYSLGVNTNSEGVEEIGLKAVLTEKGGEITTGTFTWYSSTNGFLESVGSGSEIFRPMIQNEIYRCDFSYASTESTSEGINVAYTAYFNVNNRRMVYTSYPGDSYLKGDIWIVGDDYVETDGFGDEIANFDASKMIGKMLIASNSARGVYKSTDWEVALDYENQFEIVNGELINIRNDIEGVRTDLGEVNQAQTDLLNRVYLSADGGLEIVGGSGVGQDWKTGNFRAHFTSDKLVFFFKGQPTGWIGGENIEDENPQLYVYDANVVNSLSVDGNVYCSHFTAIHPQTNKYDTTFVLQPEGNGSFSIVIGSK